MGLACKPLVFSESRLPPCAMRGSPVFLLGAGAWGCSVSDSPIFFSLGGAQSAWTLARGLLSAQFQILEFLWLLSLPKRTFPVLGQLVFMKREWGGGRENWPQLGWEGGPSFALGRSETLVMSGGLTASLRGLLRGWKPLSGQQGMACLITPFY